MHDDQVKVAEDTYLPMTPECSEGQWQRGMAWAFQQSMGLVWCYADSNPAMSQWGRRTLDRLVANIAG